MIFGHCKWHFYTNWDKLEKGRANDFQVYLNAIRWIFSNFAHPFPFWPFCVSFEFLYSLTRYNCDISVHSLSLSIDFSTQKSFFRFALASSSLAVLTARSSIEKHEKIEGCGQSIFQLILWPFGQLQNCLKLRDIAPLVKWFGPDELLVVISSR